MSKNIYLFSLARGQFIPIAFLKSAIQWVLQTWTH